MKLFDDNDPERLANFSGAVPDGLIDGTQYAGIVDRISENLANLEPGDYLSSITFVMHCVNECYEPNASGAVVPSRATDTVTALAYFVMTMAEAMDIDDLQEYIQYQRETVVPELNSTSTAIPFYDVTQDVKAVLELFDDFDSGDNDGKD